MSSSSSQANEPIAITGIGIAAPNGNTLAEFRANLLAGKSGVAFTEVRHMGQLPAGLCHFDEQKYQAKKMRKRGTRAGAIAIYCANQALEMAGLKVVEHDLSRIGIYLGITEHGNVETEEEIHQLYQNNLKTEFWSHHHNPRTVANSPAGEVSLNLGITGPAYTIGAACAAGNLGLIHACQMLQLGEIDYAIAGGISESAQTFGIYAAFAAQGALATHQDATLASRPLDQKRNGIVVGEGGGIYILEKLSSALQRKAKVHALIAGWHINSDASDFVLPNAKRQQECMEKALQKAHLAPEEIDLISLHATGTQAGDEQECEAVANIFTNTNTKINATKGFIGHTMGAAGALELAGNLPSFEDGWVHACHGLTELDPKCHLHGLVMQEKQQHIVKTILNNSFGMLGINSSLIVKKYLS